MEAFRQALGAVYFALAEAAGGDEVLDRAGNILTDAVISGAIDDPYARAAVMALVRSSTIESTEGMAACTYAGDRSGAISECIRRSALNLLEASAADVLAQGQSAMRILNYETQF